MNSQVRFPAIVVSRSRWWAFCAVCLGYIMIVIEGMVVTIALPSIQADLGFSELSLIWVVNAYLIPYSGFLLIGGRLSDLFGPRRLFLFGIALFTAASAVCGLTSSPALLISARAMQGLGGALVAPVPVSLTMNLFSEGNTRATALGLFNFVSSSGASLGLLLGGTLTSLLSWHWIFLINLPLGVVAYALCFVSLPTGQCLVTANRLDIAGAASITASLTLAVCGIVNAGKVGWHSLQTLILLTSAIASLIFFLYAEARASSPVIPLSLFRRRSLMVVSIVFMLWSFASSAWYFVSTLYLQTLLEYSAEQVGLTFLCFTLAAATFSLGVSSKLAMRFGTKRLLSLGLLMVAIGIASFARAPLHGHWVTDILPGVFLAGMGTGTLVTPTFLIATKGVAPSESGLVSGLVSTANLMGSALGLAILASAASAWTNALLSRRVSLPLALNGGYHVTDSLAAGLLTVAALMCAALLPAEEDAQSARR